MTDISTPNRTFMDRLEKMLQLCQENGVYVLLDVHQDVFSSRVCGEGVPAFAFDFNPTWDQTRSNCSARDWAQYKNTSEFNIRNPCCAKANDDNVWQDHLLKPFTSKNFMTVESQVRYFAAISDALVTDSFKSAFATFILNLAGVAEKYSNVVGIELMNEPEPAVPGLWWLLFAYVDQKLRDNRSSILLGIPDVGETIFPTLAWRWRHTKFPRKNKQFFVYHDYRKELSRPDLREALKDIGVPSLCTECDCDFAAYNLSRGVSAGYLGWHYHQYCNTRDDPWPSKPFGACITG